MRLRVIVFLYGREACVRTTKTTRKTRRASVRSGLQRLKHRPLKKVLPALKTWNADK